MRCQQTHDGGLPYGKLPESWGCRHEHAYTRLHTQKLPHPWLKVTPKQVRGICVVPVDVLLVDKIEQLKNALMDFGLNAALMAGCPESAETLRELKAILDERINELRKEGKEHEQAA